MKKKLSRIGVLSSGGDGPGMNAVFRAIVRSAIQAGVEVCGIKRGYIGAIEDQLFPLDTQSVANILQRGGTFLGTGRSEEFKTPEGRKKAYKNLRKRGIQALIVLGGDGSFNGAYKFYQEHQVPVIGIPCTIDNDIVGTDYAIGHSTAVATAVEAVDRIRDTASSHDRTFLVEVMGRNSPAIAMQVGLASGAENVLLPSEDVNYEKIYNDIQKGIKSGKFFSILVVGEGPKSGRSYEIQQELLKRYKLNTRVCILGHIQRGGTPSIQDRMIGQKMGHLAIQLAVDRFSNSQRDFALVTAAEGSEILMKELKDCLEKKAHFKEFPLQLIHDLSR